MQLEAIIQYLFVIVAIALLIWKWPGAEAANSRYEIVSVYNN